MHLSLSKLYNTVKIKKKKKRAELLGSKMKIWISNIKLSFKETKIPRRKLSTQIAALNTPE